MLPSKTDSARRPVPVLLIYYLWCMLRTKETKLQISNIFSEQVHNECDKSAMGTEYERERERQSTATVEPQYSSAITVLLLLEDKNLLF
jgi:hypothetical protein